MKKFFENQAVGLGVLKWMCIFSFLDFASTFGCAYLYHVLHIHVSRQAEAGQFSLLDPGLYPILAISIFTEEVLFRYIPLALTRLIFGRSLGPMLVVAVISSCVFGYVHGGLDHIPLQGFGGFLYCLLFLKCGGYKGKLRIALTATTVIHMVFDAVIFAWMLSHGETRL